MSFTQLWLAMKWAETGRRPKPDASKAEPGQVGPSKSGDGMLVAPKLGKNRTA